MNYVGGPEPWIDHELTAVPDLPGPLRVYKVMRASTVRIVASVSFPHHWQVPGLNYAVCGQTPPCYGDVPFQGCSCGFYAFYLPDTYRMSENGYTNGGSVLAVAEASGGIILQPLGIRAAQMRLVALSAAPRPGRALVIRERHALRRYHDAGNGTVMGIPFFDAIPDMVDAFPPQGVDELLGMSAEAARTAWHEQRHYRRVTATRMLGHEVMSAPRTMPGTAVIPTPFIQFNDKETSDARRAAGQEVAVRIIEEFAARAAQNASQSGNNNILRRIIGGKKQK